MAGIPYSNCIDSWEDYETLKFIAIWRDKLSYIQNPQKKISKEKLFQDWANELKKEGVIKNAEQVYRKLMNMKNTYAIDCSRTVWKYWSDVHEILQSSQFNEEGIKTSTESMVLKGNHLSEQAITDEISQSVTNHSKIFSEKNRSVTDVDEDQCLKDNQLLQEVKLGYDQLYEKTSNDISQMKQSFEEIKVCLLDILNIIERKSMEKISK